jgi:hypothetical protein
LEPKQLSGSLLDNGGGRAGALEPSSECCAASHRRRRRLPAPLLAAPAARSSGAPYNPTCAPIHHAAADLQPVAPSPARHQHCLRRLDVPACPPFGQQQAAAIAACSGTVCTKNRSHCQLTSRSQQQHSVWQLWQQAAALAVQHAINLAAKRRQQAVLAAA